MKNRFPVALCLGLCLSALPVVAGPAAPAAAGSKAAPAPAAAKAGAFQEDVVHLFDDAAKKVLALEEAVPQNKFTWRPAPGVRSVSELFLHVAFADYGIPKRALGKDAPADVGFDGNMAKWDTKTTDKAEIKKTLEKSFEHVRAVVKATPDADLDKKFDFFGTEMTVRAGMMVVVAHINEHLGQAIAYARSNKVTPPWSK